MLRDRAGDALPGPPASDRAGDSAEDEPHWPADGPNRHAGYGAEKSARAFAHGIGITDDALGRALARWRALRLGQ